MKKHIISVVGAVLVYLALITPMTGGLPRWITEPSKPSFVVEGDNITLHWIYDLEGTITLAQFSDVRDGGGGKLIADQLSDNVPAVAPKYQARFLVNISDTNASMTILAVQSSDNGTYRYEVTNNNLHKLNSDVEIVVLYKPENVSLVTNLSSSKICLGDVTNFTCTAEANPDVHSFLLYENQEPMNKSNSGSWLQKLLWGGNFNYTCVANNSVGIGASATLNLTVNVHSSVMPMANQTVTEGDNVTLYCNVSGSPDPSVVWTKVGSSIVVSGKSFILNDINRTAAGEYTCEESNECNNSSESFYLAVEYKPENVSLMTNISENKVCLGDVVNFTCTAEANPEVHSFLLYENQEPVNESNSGSWLQELLWGGNFNYSCVANNSVGIGESATLNLTVNVHSTVMAMANQTVTEGDNVTLYCNVSGSPEPSVLWTKVGSGSVKAGKSFILNDINRTAAGEYTCQASNECNNSSESFFLAVEYKPENVSLITNLSESKVCLGDVANFTCTAEANPDVHSFLLYENKEPISEGNSGSWQKELFLGGNFNYTCVANNSVGISESATLNLTVNVMAMANQTVTEADNVTLYCNVSGSPDPSVVWTKVGSGIAEAGKSFILNDINRTAAGEYTCEASNECNNSSESLFLAVEYKPENVSLVTNVSENKVCLGDVANFTCTAEANPVVHSYFLYENQEPLSESNSGRWNKKLSWRGYFNYTCVADNSVGVGESTTLNLTVNVHSSVMPMVNQTVAEGDNVTLFCNVSGSPDPFVVWTKVGTGIVEAGKSFILNDINRTDAGEYSCKASNECNNSSESFFLAVKYKPENVSLVTNLSENKVCLGDVVNFTCTAEANPEVHSFLLYENQEPMNKSNSGRWLQELVWEGNFNYTCVANNSVGIGESATLNLTVNVHSTVMAMANRTVTGGDNVTLYCNVSGSPEPFVVWTKVGSGIVGSGKSLNLNDINRTAAGEYTCQASNECNNSSESLFLAVEYKPENVSLVTNLSETKVRLGDVANFTCTAEANPEVNSYLLYENQEPMNKSNSGSWLKKLVWGGNFNYTCVANNSVGIGESATLNLTVNVHSSVMAMANQTVTEGENVALYCNVSGSPEPSVVWAKVGTGIVKAGKTFNLNDINRTAAGEYTCEASNECSNSSESLFLVVEYKPENVSLMTNLSSSKICLGDVANFTCTAEANPDVHSYLLYENQEPMNKSNSGSWLMELFWGGYFNYTCVANNSVGVGESATLNLTVNVNSSVMAMANQTVTEGDNVTLYCNVSGSPEPSVLWTKVGSGIVGSGKSFILNDINRTDAGEYTCEASNECSNSSESFYLAVEYKPDNVSLITNISENKVCLGDVVRFTCTAEANPVVHSYILYENQTSVNESNSGQWLHELSSRDHVNYTCVANNSAGSGKSTTLTLNITAVRSSVMNMANRTVTEGDNVTLYCNVSGSPDPFVVWTKVGSGTFKAGKSWILNDINRTAAGEYTCQASNECNNSTESFFLAVQYKPESVSLISNISGHKACLGDVVNFTCMAKANPAVSSYMLFENQRYVNGSYSGSWLNQLSSRGHSNYTCAANNSVGIGESSAVTLWIYVAPIIEPLTYQTVAEEDNVTLYCDVSGSPIPSVNWTNMNTGRIKGGKTWSITYINRADAGEYKCEATNECGTYISSMIVNVHYRAMITVAPANLTVQAGQDAFLQCIASGNPKPNITWTRESGRTIVGSGNSLKFTPARLSDSGLYTCKATNEIGNSSSTSAYLVVTDRATEVINATMTIKSEEYDNSLADQKSDQATKLTKDVQQAVDSVFRTDDSYVGTEVRGFRRGSVIVDLALTFNQGVSEEMVISVLKDAASDGRLGDLEVDPLSIVATSGSEPTRTPTSSATNTPSGDECSCCTCNCKDTVFIAVIVVLIVIIILLVIYIAWLHKKGPAQEKRRNQRPGNAKESYSNGVAMEDLSNNTEQASSPTHYINLKGSTNDESPIYAEPSEYEPLHPSTYSFEVPRDHVTVDEVIGDGAFGQVAKGAAIDLRGRPGKTDVAIKMLKGNALATDKECLLSELELLKTLKPHPHVIKLLGCVTNTEPVLVLIEYVPFGDLLGYLRKSRGLKDTYYRDPDIKPQTSLIAETLMKFAWQIADGMHYLSTKDIIHRDLAARNVLVGEREICKVTDFGMARDVQQEKIYERRTKGRLPLKWTAYEALLHGTYTTKSDVWSYGVVLYEIFTIGGSPYPRMPKEVNMIELLKGQYRMPRPDHVDDKLYQIMLKCWQNDPDERPTFADLRDQLKEMEKTARLINMDKYDQQLYANVEDVV